jgi:two-component system chemotaxis response regulator CheY
MRILVVDDQKTLGLALSWTLTRLGHETRVVNGGRAAWDILLNEDWRLVLTDWMMPDVDGLELCRRIRGRVSDPYRYVIMLTVRTERSDRLEGLQAGADDFLTKPVDEEELIVRIEIAKRILTVQAELEEKNARLEAMASTDPLTGLANRRCLDDMMRRSPLRSEGHVLYAVVSLDIDHFKSYNDRFGHCAGDEVLRIVAELLRSGTRSSDRVVRTGGEEFVIVMLRTGPDEALKIAERLRKSIAEYPWPFRAVTASFGVATGLRSQRDGSLADILEASDRALFHSKVSGRNRITCSSPAEVAEVDGKVCLAGNGFQPA